MMLCNAFGMNLTYGSSDEIFKDVCIQVSEYKNAYSRSEEDLFWPVNASPVLYENGFNFEDKKARLQPVGEAELFMKKTSADTVAVRLEEKLVQQGIIKN